MNEYSYFAFFPLPSMLMRPSVLKFKVTHKEVTEFFICEQSVHQKEYLHPTTLVHGFLQCHIY